MLQDDNGTRNTAPTTPRKAGLWQVAATMFWGMCMIGKRRTWEKDGATITLRQAIIGAVIAGCIVVALLVLLARWVVARAA